MVKVIKDDIIKASIDKRVKALLEPRIGKMAYAITVNLIVGYIKTLLKWAKEHEFEIEK